MEPGRNPPAPKFLADLFLRSAELRATSEDAKKRAQVQRDAAKKLVLDIRVRLRLEQARLEKLSSVSD